MRTPVRLAAIPAVAALALLAACGSEAATTPAATSAPATTATAATSAPATAAPATSTDQAPTTTGTEEPATGEATEITVKVGVDDSPTRVEQVALGDEVVMSMQSDADEEYHLHGYDLEEKAAAGVEITWTFTADKAGRFELESHTTNQVLLVLEVA